MKYRAFKLSTFNTTETLVFRYLGNMYCTHSETLDTVTGSGLKRIINSEEGHIIETMLSTLSEDCSDEDLIPLITRFPGLSLFLPNINQQVLIDLIPRESRIVEHIENITAEIAVKAMKNGFHFHEHQLSLDMKLEMVRLDPTVVESRSFSRDQEFITYVYDKPETVFDLDISYETQAEYMASMVHHVKDRYVRKDMDFFTKSRTSLELVDLPSNVKIALSFYFDSGNLVNLLRGYDGITISRYLAMTKLFNSEIAFRLKKKTNNLNALNELKEIKSFFELRDAWVLPVTDPMVMMLNRLSTNNVVRFSELEKICEINMLSFRSLLNTKIKECEKNIEIAERKLKEVDEAKRAQEEINRAAAAKDLKSSAKAKENKESPMAGFWIIGFFVLVVMICLAIVN